MIARIVEKFPANIAVGVDNYNWDGGAYLRSHCEERSDEAIFSSPALAEKIASLRSQ